MSTAILEKSKVQMKSLNEENKNGRFITVSDSGIVRRDIVKTLRSSAGQTIAKDVISGVNQIPLKSSSKK